MAIRLPRHPAVRLSDAEIAVYLEFACQLADASGAAILPHFRVPLHVSNKGDTTTYDPVTIADREAETAIRTLITQTYPEHGIYGEEHGYQAGTSGLTWVIDPIDGTRAFITGISLWGTLIALYDGERPILGVMDQPFTHERFVGTARGAELRQSGTRIALRSRPCPDLARAFLQTTHPSMFKGGAEQHAFEAIAARVQLTRYSGDCYSYCMLAHGFIDLVIESGLLPYDVQALIPIVEAAGGVITDWSGGSAVHGGQIIAAGDRRVHAEALALLRPAAATA